MAAEVAVAPVAEPTQAELWAAAAGGVRARAPAAPPSPAGAASSAAAAASSLVGPSPAKTECFADEESPDSDEEMWEVEFRQMYWQIRTIRNEQLFRVLQKVCDEVRRRGFVPANVMVCSL